MQARIITRIALSGLALSALTLACEQPATHLPSTPSGPSVNTVEVIGPASIPPGQPAQFSASLRLADGTVKTGSSGTNIRWRTSNGSVLQVNQTGLVTPMAAQGDAFITAEIPIGSGVRTGTREVVVQPPGTFRLVGTVVEDGNPSFFVPDARVEVSSGSPFAISNSLGQYRLYGVPPVADIRVSANEYGTQTFPVQLSANTTKNFALPLTGSRPTLNGNYTVSIDVQACGSGTGLPADLMHRTYDAAVSQNGSNVDVKLLGGQFRTNSIAKGDHFSGTTINGGVRFNLDFYGYYDGYFGPADYPSVVERLGDGTYLSIAGQVTANGTPITGLSGNFAFVGVDHWDSAFPGTAHWLGGCWQTVAFKLTPR